MEKFIIAVGAHPDDIEISCSGTLCYLKSVGYSIVSVYLTKGEGGGDSEKRVIESKKSNEIIGTSKVIFADFKDMEVPNSIEVISYLENICKKYNPDIVFTHSAQDTHQDHRSISASSLSAFRKVPLLLSYESPSTTPNFIPSVFFDITNFMDKKEKILEYHQTQKQKDYMDWKAMMDLASFRGRQANVQQAEAFQSLRIKLNDLLDK